MNEKLIKPYFTNNDKITKQELWQIEEENKNTFINSEQYKIRRDIRLSARNQKRTCEVPYHPLLDSFFEELIQGGLKIESRTIDKITLSWST